MAFAAQADIVNGSFDSAAAGVVQAGTFTYAQLNQGWYTNGTSHNFVIAGNGVADRNDNGQNSYAGMGQLFTYSGAGLRTLRINITSTDADVDNDWAVTFWGYDQIGGATALASADQFNLGNTNSLAAGGNYTETELVKDTPMNIGTVMKAKRSASPVISRCARAATPSLRASIRSKCSASKSASVVSTAGFQSLDPCVFYPL